MVYPMPAEIIKNFAKTVDKLYVIEELDPFIEDFCMTLGLEVVGKSLFPICGELNAQIIREKPLDVKAENITAAKVALPAGPELPVRPPVLCPGCPHRGTFYVLNKLELNVSGDIGCYTLGAMAPHSAMNSVICMGGSVGVAFGMELADKSFAENTVAVIGDSTFIHSGITGLIDMAYNQSRGTVIILDNAITGMTGHQYNPITGYTLKGKPAKIVDLEALCRSVGVESVRVADPFDIEAVERIIKEEVAKPELSVVILRRPCALLKYVKFPGALTVDKDKCKNCKMCLKLGCAALVAEGPLPETKTHVEIDSALCNGCGLCQNICKFGAIGGGSNE